MKYAWDKPFFKDREQAARLLAERLADYRGRKPLVLAVPRGAVPMGRILADALNGDLDVILAGKIRDPANPEFALGAVEEGGEVYLAPWAASLGYTEEKLGGEIRLELEALEKRRKLYRSSRPHLDPGGRVVILVDDGIATGSTLLAAIRNLRRRGPLRVVVAAAVAPPEVMEKLGREADELAVLAVESEFGAVGEFFEDFRQVTDEEVIQALGKSGSQVP